MADSAGQPPDGQVKRAQALGVGDEIYADKGWLGEDGHPSPPACKTRREVG